MAAYPSSVFSGPAGNVAPEEMIFGSSDAMQFVRNKVEKVAGAPLPVLIRGESGTGKEVIAKFIHNRSPWKHGPFVKINCPAIPGALLESELFGYEKGAFTGAYNSKSGWVEVAQGGTLFLDEIAELDLALQAKLLQLLQDGRFSRLGGQQDKQAKVRVICSTNRSLEHAVEAGHFRQDLLYRINVVTIDLPPLRERGADIPKLVEYFRCCYSSQYNCRPRPVSDRLIELLLQHDWPGNIRELENLMKRYVILDLEEEGIACELSSVEHNRMPADFRAGEPISLKKLTRQAVREMERKIILEVLRANNWNRKETARILNISYRALFYKIKETGVRQTRRLEPQPAQEVPAAALSEGSSDHPASRLNRILRRWGPLNG